MSHPISTDERINLPFIANVGNRDRNIWQHIIALVGDAAPMYPVLLERVCGSQGWSAAHAANAIEEYRRFLYLSVVTREQIGPSRPVDEVWHEVIKLHEPCNGEGCLLHHYVTSHICDFGEEEDRRNKENAVEAYRKAFGHPPAEFWSPQLNMGAGSTTCGPGCGGRDALIEPFDYTPVGDAEFGNHPADRRLRSFALQGWAG